MNIDNLKLLNEIALKYLKNNIAYVVLLETDVEVTSYTY